MADKKNKDKQVKVYNTDMTKEEKEKVLNETLAKIEKEFGKGAIMTLTDAKISDVDVLPTGCLSIDLALGIGGLPRGRIVEIYGPESSGKTTLSLHVISETQKNGGNVAFIDAEHALDPEYAKALGIDLSRLYVSQPDNGEQALDITHRLVESAAFDLVVIDSVAALTPKAEIDGEMGASYVGLQARLMSQALRKLASVANKTKTCIVCINQLREKVGVVYGNPEVTPGGKALKFYASVRIDIRRKQQITENSEVVGNHTVAKIVKNKLAPPFRVAEFDIRYGQGINKMSSLIDIAAELDVIQKAGSWYSYNGEKLGQGTEATRKVLESKPELAAEIEQKVRAVAAEKDGLFVGSADDTDDGEESFTAE